MIICHIAVQTNLKHRYDQGIPFFRDFGGERRIYRSDVNIVKILMNYFSGNKKKQNGNLKKIAVNDYLNNIKIKI